jgi:hypothetical protein
MYRDSVETTHAASQACYLRHQSIPIQQGRAVLRVECKPYIQRFTFSPPSEPQLTLAPRAPHVPHATGADMTSAALVPEEAPLPLVTTRPISLSPTPSAFHHEAFPSLMSNTNPVTVTVKQKLGEAPMSLKPSEPDQFGQSTCEMFKAQEPKATTVAQAQSSDTNPDQQTGKRKREQRYNHLVRIVFSTVFVCPVQDSVHLL